MEWTQRVRDATKIILGKPVCNIAYQKKQMENVLMQTSWFDASVEDWEASKSLLYGEHPVPETARDKVKILLCQFEHPYGGIFTILRLADMLQRDGFKTELIIYDNPLFNFEPHMNTILKYFPSLQHAVFSVLTGDVNEIGASEFVIATFWPSANQMLKMRNVRHKIYLIQDYEPAFYPAGTSYALAEMTYRMPFHHIYNTKGLAEYIDMQYKQPGIHSMFFTPAVDERYFQKPRPLGDPIRMLFYARPNTPRNAFELVVAFARAVKERYGKRVEIAGAGANAGQLTDLCDGIMTFSGIVDYDALPEFYASFDIIISFMITKHPSYLPFEAMASGCAVIANCNESNEWFFRDGQNCVVSQPTVPELLQAFERLTDPEEFARIAMGGYHTVRQVKWDEEIGKIKDFILSLRQQKAYS